MHNIIIVIVHRCKDKKVYHNIAISIRIIFIIFNQLQCPQYDKMYTSDQ